MCRWSILLLLLIIALSGNSQSADYSFFTQKIDRGLRWHQFHGPWEGQLQHTNILRINPRHYRLDLAFAQDTLLPTSTFAQRAAARAAINAGFFDIRQGGSVTFLRSDGQPIADNRPNLVESDNEITEGAITITADGQLHIRNTRQDTAWRDSRYLDILVTGPLLLEKGDPSPLQDRAFNTARHPRSGACITQNGSMLLVAVDGRNEKAAGMSLREFTYYLYQQGCRDAINLDGGGSTTLVIAGQPDRGVVNMPSDNKQFDHQGERAVANALLVFPRKAKRP